MKKHSILLTSLVLFGLVAACGDDSNNSGETTSNNAAGNNAANNNTGNNPANNNTGNNPTNNNTGNNPANNNAGGDAVMEGEEPNNDADTATPFELGQTVGGTIAEGFGEESDSDVFKFDVQAGTVVSLELANAGAGFVVDGASQFVAVLFDETGEFYRTFFASYGSSRQIFIPQTGTYYIQIVDYRSIGEDAHGGATSTYRLKTGTAELSPVTVASGSRTSSDLNGGSVRAFSLTPSADEIVRAEIFGQRLAEDSELDTVLYVWDVASGAVVRENDDIDYQAGIYDSSVSFSATQGKQYLLVTDAYVNQAEAPIELALAQLDDSVDVPGTLTVGTDATGVIGAANGEEFDTDFFVVTVQPGEIVRVELTADGAALQPAAALFTSSGNYVASALPIGNLAAMEFAHPADAEEADTYYVLVDDVRNVPMDETGTPALVGGEGFGYTLKAVAGDWTAAAATLPLQGERNVAQGSYDWQQVSVGAMTLLHVGTTSTAPNVAPVSAIALTGLNLGTSAQAFDFVFTEASTVLLGARDEFFRGGEGYSYQTDFRAYDFGSALYASIAAPAESASAQNAPTLATPAKVSGTLTGGYATIGRQYFKVSVRAGQSLAAMTIGEGESTDTVIKLYGGDLTTPLASNDDYVGMNQSYNSALLFDATTDTDLLLVVEPFCSERQTDACGGNGNYELRVLVQ